MSSKFAKLFESERHGQILVVLEGGENGPNLTFSVCPPDLGVCSIAMGFTDDDEGWDAAEKKLDECDQSLAEKAAEAIFETAEKATKEPKP